MFKRAGISFKPHFRRAHQQAFASTYNVRQNLRGKSALIFASTALVGSVVLIGHFRIIHGDSADISVTPKKSIYGLDSDAPGVLRALIWGSNKFKTLDPEHASQETIRAPTQAKWLDNVALRDLALQQSHAACVDARGDVYQWGEGFFGESSSSNAMPKLTLKGKDIVQLQLTEEKLYALSASGKVYILATNAQAQALPKDISGGAWWGFGWLWGKQKIGDYAEVTPQQPFGWRESFVSISAGKNHLLAVTSKGRTYAHPINMQANHYGQLGLRHFEIPDPASGITKNASNLRVELVPKSLVDPFSNSTRSVRGTSTTSDSNLANIDDKDIRFCPYLFEVPVLRGVDTAQVAAGSRTSFARTKTGKVLGWGANEYGQIGLGSNVTLDTIIVPTEVILWRMVPAKTSSHCSNIAAGGDLTAFTVERVNDGSPNTLDLLMCGNGQQGGLGNNSYSNAQGNPVSAKNVSGLLQYSDKTQSLQPIRPENVSISPTGHVILALNSSSDSGGIGGRDVMAWGRNYDSELGNGKKASLVMPTSLNRPDGERLMLMSVKANQVFDLSGKVWKRGVKVEQRVVAGYASTAVYWKVVS